MSRHIFAAMGTTVTVLAPAEHGPHAFKIVRALFDDWERTLSRFLPESELSRLNARAGTAVEVSPLLWVVLTTALEAARATDGRYDPTLQRQMLWIGYDRTFTDIDRAGRGTARPALPARPGGDWRLIQLDPAHRRVTLPEGAGLDFGGIAKGMAVDAALDQLRALSLTPALVNAGGDLAVAGQPPCQPDWPIAVPGRDRYWTIPLRNGTIATSTVTRRNWRQGETARHHLIDPATGEPARSDILSVTVVAPYCRQAEVGAKVALLLGAQAGARFLETRGLAGLLIPTTGDYLTAGPWPHEAMKEIARETQ
ncbi:MAG TPA: FAD:protein FMN transferase [Ktedonobacterales bacterium]|jgi:thiamine biosynthesis lipoprotein